MFTTLVVKATDRNFRPRISSQTSYFDILLSCSGHLADRPPYKCSGGSSQGGHAYLDIEVVNKLNSKDDCMLKVIGEHTIDYDRPLIYDYIPSEVAQFCKNYTLDDIVIREFDKLDEVLLRET